MLAIFFYVIFTPLFSPLLEYFSTFNETIPSEGVKRQIWLSSHAVKSCNKETDLEGTDLEKEE